MFATAAQNSISEAPQRRGDREKTSVWRFGIARTALAAASNISAFHPRPCGPVRLDFTHSVAVLGARSGRKRPSSHWSNSTRHRTPAARSGRPEMATKGAGPRRLCTRIVRYAACAGINICERVLQVNAREMMSRWVVTNDAIKSRSSTGRCKRSGDPEATCVTIGEEDGTKARYYRT